MTPARVRIATIETRVDAIAVRPTLDSSPLLGLQGGIVFLQKIQPVPLTRLCIAEKFVLSRQIEMDQKIVAEPQIDHGLKRLKRIAMFAKRALHHAEIQVQGR